MGRSERIAWAAMQMDRVAEAEEVPITPLTLPARVMEFIDSHPGLFETCEDYPSLVAEYAPQLTIPGFEGDLAESIDSAFRESCDKATIRRSSIPVAGTPLSEDRTQPLCDEEWSLRHSSFGNYPPSDVAHAYFSGGLFGPSVSPYQNAEHLFWLLSSSSDWLPIPQHEILIDGMASWASWPWTEGKGKPRIDKGLPPLAAALQAAAEGKRFRWSKAIKDDVLSRIEFAINTLKLSDSPESIFDRFMELDFPVRYVKTWRSRQLHGAGQTDQNRD